MFKISHESLSLKFQAILLARSGDIGFVSVESRDVLVKINEMALKVPSQMALEVPSQFQTSKK